MTETKRSRLIDTILKLSAEEVDQIWFPGVRGLLAQLHTHQNVRLALCTSSKCEQVDALIDREPENVGKEALSVRVTQDDVPQGAMIHRIRWPHPAPYQVR